MIRLVLLVALCFTLCSAHAQDKQIAKLEKWYSKGLYSTAYDRASYFLLKFDEEPEIHLYAAISCERMLKIGRNTSDSLLLARVIYHTQQAHQFNGSQQVFKKHPVEAARIEAVLKKFTTNNLPGYEALQQKARTVLVEVFKQKAPAPGTGKANTAKPTDEAPKSKQKSTTPAQSATTKQAEAAAPTSQQVIAYAESLMGTPYKYAGCDPNGFDCSGFTYYVFKHFNINLPRSSTEMAKIGQPVSEKELQPGDLVFFGSKKGKSFSVSHVGIVHSVGEGAYYSFIHSSSRGVVVDDPMAVSWDYWQNKYLFTRRLPNL